MGARHSPAPQLINGAGLVAVHNRLPVGACVGSHNGSRRGLPRPPGQYPVGECAGIAAGGLEKPLWRGSVIVGSNPTPSAQPVETSLDQRLCLERGIFTGPAGSGRVRPSTAPRGQIVGGPRHASHLVTWRSATPPFNPRVPGSIPGRPTR